MTRGGAPIVGVMKVWRPRSRGGAPHGPPAAGKILCLRNPGSFGGMAASNSDSSLKHLAEGAARSVGIDHAKHFHSRILALPGARCTGRGKEATGVAEGGADGAHLFRRDNGDDGSGRVERADAGCRIDCQPYGNASGRAGRFDMGRTANRPGRTGCPAHTTYTTACRRR